MGKIKKNQFITFLLFIVFLLRIPTLFEPYWYGDEGIYLSIGYGLRHGLSLYKDLFDNKPPAIYLLSALANGQIFWLRFFLDVSVLLTIYFFYQLAKNFFLKEKAARLATVFFAILTTLPLVEGNIANAEIFILLPTVFVFSVLTRVYFQEKKGVDKELTKQKMFVLGVILGIGLLFKVTAFFDLAFLVLFLLFFREKKIQLRNKLPRSKPALSADRLTRYSGTSPEEFVSLSHSSVQQAGRYSASRNKGAVFGFLGGYFSPLLLCCLYFSLRGTFGDFWQACFVKTAGYLSSWQTGKHEFSLITLLKSEFSFRSLFLLLVILFYFIQKKKISPQALFVSLWLTFSLYAATLSGRPYAHYLIQCLPAFCLCLPLIYFSVKQKSQWKLVGVPLVILAWAIVRYQYWFYPSFSYYLNFKKFLLRERSKQEFFDHFNSKTSSVYKLAEIIQAYTPLKERIFIWADEPYLYILSKRLPATRFLVAYHVIDLKQEDKVSSQLNKNLPFLVVIDQNTKIFQELKNLVANQYFLIWQEKSFLVFRRTKNNE